MFRKREGQPDQRRPARTPSSVGPLSEQQRAGPDEREREERRAAPSTGTIAWTPACLCLDARLVGDRERQPERQRAPELLAVGADRLGDHLPDGPRLRAAAAAAAQASQRRDQRRDARRERGERLVDPPARSVGLADGVRDRTHLERRHAGAGGGAQHAEALHRLDLADGAAADPPGRRDRQDVRVRAAARRAAASSAASGSTRSMRGNVDAASSTSA